MKSNKLQVTNHKVEQPRRGMILFLTLLILGVTATAVVLLLAQSSVNGFLSIDEQAKSEQVRSELFGCLDEVLIHFYADSNYSPTSVDLASYTCVASVIANGTERTVTLTRTNSGLTRRVVVVLNTNVTPLTVSSVLEQ
ncbi:hypothetical protein A3C09_03155 [Candidatus Uhrbacteria bacterium RIFCSPHIGHO2_02_FULL_47_44]|uniref:Uncharacterized protein n=1 Tax=Candidatus Uhrbacteria bacterium RIFCSPLOWO2_02_FULL_48_18 TaxID=1802408 RepID=A0A1F7V7V0_9BACT|nr:MAG: hypothetical protein A2839_03135 [Candidatus Uhrbacteria bacterium RIFCSPHIGHO2_01_FULL_47_10]OGL70910.1 MAG: hypothetical protein A3C09_03155 [Candidatus Uhrbacteria bacterium RIFCSPHIGHO2_02_FULL_47_44]OGL76973.1 MAG: hypothetical protein A3E97_05210 [Candidatus Uhrbacteria bacterium RIFCSPHIGHO2_12_FULL_47_12]OGL80765.1 MAG: hypothetical protein A3B20_05265 [Candidatus Uhrbacteria bacterium RIFCSPLOWO2_01_FULL_47_17]OGL86583.1 MAG: hypothetical protein A3I41_04835 [Candidatus Uhrbact